MPPLPNRPPKGASTFNRLMRRNPAMFGIPFVCLIVGGSFGLSNLTQIRYDIHDQRTRKACLLPAVRSGADRARQVSTEEEQQLASKKKRKFDIREEYFRLQEEEDKNDWEPVRVPRPAGVPEWGVAPENPRQLPESGPRQPAARPRRVRRTEPRAGPDEPDSTAKQ
ncbi:hypothetical protein AURDEDRAFT_54831 [Auricularia subglabra TFB-10046 SS5]|nr:hypothetical protein AURDEDRAFT_54831 [Auricularia subglabra TFB-10046 SS5]